MFGIDRLHVGCAENINAITGCTVLIFDGGARASADVRGASPGTREIALLAPDKQTDRIDAILLTGGSAFGLAAATGVVKFLSERDIGYPTPWKLVPIVPAAVIFDLNIGSSDTFPDERMGYDACQNAYAGGFIHGSHGAGAGATVGKWAGIGGAMKSGQGISIYENAGIKVVAIAVVNAVGDIMDNSGRVIAGAQSNGGFRANSGGERERMMQAPAQGTNTTLVAVTTNVSLSKVELNRLAQRSHDALARRIVPVHTGFDGDTVFAASTSEVDAKYNEVEPIIVDTVSESIIDAVTSAESIGGYASYSGLKG